MFVCAQDFNLILRNLILKRSSESFDIWRQNRNWGYGILLMMVCNLLLILILIMQVARRIANQQLVVVNSSRTNWLHGNVRSRTLLPYPHAKLSMLQPPVAVLRFYGYNNRCTIMVWNFLLHLFFVDNSAAIAITENLVSHKHSKHIDIGHHFLRDCFEKQLIQLQKVDTVDNVSDIFTKAFDSSRFHMLVVALGMIHIDWDHH